MSITRLNNNSITSVTALPSGIDTGKVLQVVSNTKTSVFSTNANTLVDTGFDIVITPSSTSSKVWVQYTVPVYQASANLDFRLAIYRNDTANLHDSSLNHFIRGNVSDTYYATTLSAYDSPSSTSAVTYTLYGRSQGTGQFPAGNAFATVIAYEIAG